MGLPHRNIGQLTLAAGTVDDTVGWVLLSVVTVVATTGARAGEIGVSIGRVAAFIVVLALVGRPLVRLCFRVVDGGGNDGLVVAATVVTIVLAAAAAASVGLEPVFGAFAAGVVMSASGAVESRRLVPLRQVQLIMATVGLRLGILTSATYTFVVVIAIVTSVMAVPILRLAMARVEQTAEEQVRETVMAGESPG